MKAIAEMIKELITLLIMMEVCAFTFRFVLGRTWIGRMLLKGKRNSRGHLKNRYNIWKQRCKTTKNIILFIAKGSKKLYVGLKNRYEVTEVESSKEVVNGGKIIDFNTAKELRHKWEK